VVGLQLALHSKPDRMGAAPGAHTPAVQRLCTGRSDALLPAVGHADHRNTTTVLYTNCGWNRDQAGERGVHVVEGVVALERLSVAGVGEVGPILLRRGENATVQKAAASH